MALRLRVGVISSRVYRARPALTGPSDRSCNLPSGLQAAIYRGQNHKAIGLRVEVFSLSCVVFFLFLPSEYSSLIHLLCFPCSSPLLLLLYFSSREGSSCVFSETTLALPQRLWDQLGDHRQRKAAFLEQLHRITDLRTTTHSLSTTEKS